MVASWLVRSSPVLAARVQVLAENVVFCSWTKILTLAVPFSTQVYKWVLEYLILVVILRWTSIPSSRSRNTLSHFKLSKSRSASSNGPLGSYSLPACYFTYLHPIKREKQREFCAPRKSTMWPLTAHNADSWALTIRPAHISILGSISKEKLK